MEMLTSSLYLFASPYMPMPVPSTQKARITKLPIDTESQANPDHCKILSSISQIQSRSPPSWPGMDIAQCIKALYRRLH